jgi:hypothetical protein
LIQSVERGGLLAGKKKLIVGAALGVFIIFLGSVFLRPRYAARDDHQERRVAAARRPAAADTAAAVGKRPSAPKPVTDTPKAETATVEAAPSEEAPVEDPYGSVLVRVIWGEDKTPAAGVRGMVIPWGSPHLYIDEQETLRWDPVLAQDREIVGRVLDENGLPLPGFQVLAEEMLGGVARKSTQTRLKTDEEGRFRITELSDLAYRVLVFEPESRLACFFADGVRPNGEEVVVEVEKESLSSAFLLGTVLAPAGDPAGGAKVICFSGLAGYRVDFADKETGEIKVGPLPPGHYRLEVQAQGYPPLGLEIEELSPRERRNVGLVWLKSGNR